MKPLVDEMVQDDPAKRPTMDEVVRRFGEILNSLSWWTLSQQLVPNDEDPPNPFFSSVRHFFRAATNVLTLRSPLPTPKA